MTLIKKRDGHGAPNELLDVQIYAIQLNQKLFKIQAVLFLILSEKVCMFESPSGVFPKL